MFAARADAEEVVRAFFAAAATPAPRSALDVQPAQKLEGEDPRRPVASGSLTDAFSVVVHVLIPYARAVGAPRHREGWRGATRRTPVM